MTIREINNKVKRETLTIKELKNLYTLTTEMLKEIGDLRSVKYTTKKEYSEASNKKECLWSIRNSIRQRIKKLTPVPSYIVTVEDGGAYNNIGIIHNISEDTLKKVSETIKKDGRWAGLNLKVGIEPKHTFPSGIVLGTNCQDIEIVISMVEELDRCSL